MSNEQPAEAAVMEPKVGDIVRVTSLAGPTRMQKWPHTAYTTDEDRGLVVGHTGKIIYDLYGVLYFRPHKAKQPTDGYYGGWSFYPDELEALNV